MSAASALSPDVALQHPRSDFSTVDDAVLVDGNALGGEGASCALTGRRHVRIWDEREDATRGAIPDVANPDAPQPVLTLG